MGGAEVDGRKDARCKHRRVQGALQGRVIGDRRAERGASPAANAGRSKLRR
jgi:hypothetical protein